MLACNIGDLMSIKFAKVKVLHPTLTVDLFMVRLNLFPLHKVYCQLQNLSTCATYLLKILSPKKNLNRT